MSRVWWTVLGFLLIMLPSQAAAISFELRDDSDKYLFDNPLGCVLTFGLVCATDYYEGFDLNTFTFLSGNEVESRRGGPFAPAQQNIINSLAIEVRLKDDDEGFLDIQEHVRIRVWVGSHACDWTFEVDTGDHPICSIPSQSYTDWYNWGRLAIQATGGDFDVDHIRVYGDFTPVPEPSTGLFVATILLALGAMHWRRSHRRSLLREG